MNPMDLYAMRSELFRQPEEAANWYIVADWLEDHGEPLRAEATRVQYQLRRERLSEWQREQLVQRQCELAAQGGHSLPLLSPLGIEMVWVPAGAFWMGSSIDKAGKRRAEIAKGFYLGIYPVTQWQWQAVMGSNPSHFKGDDLPVECVSWSDMRAFLEKLNQLENEGGQWRYRLPTDAEWEYACRSPAALLGTKLTKEQCGWDFYFDSGPSNSLSSTQANFNGNFPAGGAPQGPFLGQTSRVGLYRPNSLGIYDLHGNVWERCLDEGAPGNSARVLRGGGWNGLGGTCRAAYRFNYACDMRFVGFRLARSSVK